jgi:hypothetical protein
MKQINNIQDLIKEVSDLNENTKIKITYSKEPEFNKKNRSTKQPFTEFLENIKVKSIVKESEFCGSLVFNYRELLSIKLKETNQQPTESTREPWHESYSKNGAIRTHKFSRETYLYILVDEEKKSSSKYLTENNQEVLKELLIDFLPKESTTKELVQVRLIKLDNILKIESEKFTYTK